MTATHMTYAVHIIGVNRAEVLWGQKIVLVLKKSLVYITRTETPTSGSNQNGSQAKQTHCRFLYFRQLRRRNRFMNEVPPSLSTSTCLSIHCVDYVKSLLLLLLHCRQ